MKYAAINLNKNKVFFCPHRLCFGKKLIKHTDKMKIQLNNIQPIRGGNRFFTDLRDLFRLARPSSFRDAKKQVRIEQ